MDGNHFDSDPNAVLILVEARAISGDGGVVDWRWISGV